MHNTTWAPNTMLSSRKMSKKVSDRRMDKPYSYDPSGHGRGFNKRISQLRGIAVTRQQE